LRRTHLDPAHPALAETLTWYGVLHCERGDASAGASMLREALALRTRVFGVDHLASAQSGALLAVCALPAGTGTARDDAAAQRVLRDPGSGVPLRRRLDRGAPVD
jgi:hypothetical protein